MMNFSQFIILLTLFNQIAIAMNSDLKSSTIKKTDLSCFESTITKIKLHSTAIRYYEELTVQQEKEILDKKDQLQNLQKNHEIEIDDIKQAFESQLIQQKEIYLSEIKHLKDDFDHASQKEKEKISYLMKEKENLFDTERTRLIRRFQTKLIKKQEKLKTTAQTLESALIKFQDEERNCQSMKKTIQELKLQLLQAKLKEIESKQKNWRILMLPAILGSTFVSSNICSLLFNGSSLFMQTLCNNLPNLCASISPSLSASASALFTSTVYLAAFAPITYGSLKIINQDFTLGENAQKIKKELQELRNTP